MRVGDWASIPNTSRVTMDPLFTPHSVSATCIIRSVWQKAREPGAQGAPNDEYCVWSCCMISRRSTYMYLYFVSSCCLWRWRSAAPYNAPQEYVLLVPRKKSNWSVPSRLVRLHPGRHSTARRRVVPTGLWISFNYRGHQQSGAFSVHACGK